MFIVSLAIFIDIGLAIAEYKQRSKVYLSSRYSYPKVWLIDHILCNVALGILVLLPIILLSLVIVSIILVYIILGEIFLAISEFQAAKKIAEEKERAKESGKTEELNEDPNSISFYGGFDSQILSVS